MPVRPTRALVGGSRSSDLGQLEGRAGLAVNCAFPDRSAWRHSGMKSERTYLPLFSHRPYSVAARRRPSLMRVERS